MAKAEDKTKKRKHVIEEEEEVEKNETEVKKDTNEGTTAKVEEEDGGEKTKRKRKRKRKKKNESNETNGGVDGNGGGGGLSTADKLKSLDHTVYVEGIPFDCSEDEVKGFFVENGCEDVLQMRLPRWQDSGRLRGYGHVVFNTTESKTKAISELSGKNLRRRYLTIQEAKGEKSQNDRPAPRAQPEDCRLVFVKNLPYHNITEEDVHDLFRSCGKIVDGGVRLTRNYQTKQLKGFGFVEFKNPEGAYAAVQRAAKVDGMKIGGRCLYVDYEESVMKGSFRTAEGKLWQSKHGSVHKNRNSRR